MNINDWLIEDTAFTLKNFSQKFIEWERIPSWERDDSKDPYIMAANAMLIVIKKGFGDCFAIDDFIKNVECGGFIDYDGSGRWVDKEGNDLGYIRCDVEWLKQNKPENAEFIMWYNK